MGDSTALFKPTTNPLNNNSNFSLNAASTITNPLNNHSNFNNLHLPRSGSSEASLSTEGSLNSYSVTSAQNNTVNNNMSNGPPLTGSPTGPTTVTNNNYLTLHGNLSGINHNNANQCQIQQNHRNSNVNNNQQNLNNVNNQQNQHLQQQNQQLQNHQMQTVNNQHQNHQNGNITINNHQSNLNHQQLQQNNTQNPNFLTQQCEQFSCELFELF